MRLLHLSDTHLDPFDGPNARGVNATDSLRGMLADLRHQRDLDAIVVSGDIADDGSVGAYEGARSIIGEFAAERGVPVFYSTGNHDERSAFAEVLGSGHLDAAGGDAADAVFPSDGGERAAATMLDGFRFITLDSLMPGKIYGRIGTSQLDWLRGLLAEPSERGSVVVFHHPPIFLGDPSQRLLGLHNPTELAEAIRGSDVRLILCGHFHLQISGHLESTPVWVTPGVVNRIDMTAPYGVVRFVRGASASLVEIGTPTSPMFHTFHARDPRAGELIEENDKESVAAVLEEIRAES